MNSCSNLGILCIEQFCLALNFRQACNRQLYGATRICVSKAFLLLPWNASSSARSVILNH